MNATAVEQSPHPPGRSLSLASRQARRLLLSDSPGGFQIAQLSPSAWSDLNCDPAHPGVNHSNSLPTARHLLPREIIRTLQKALNNESV